MIWNLGSLFDVFMIDSDVNVTPIYHDYELNLNPINLAALAFSLKIKK